MKRIAIIVAFVVLCVAAFSYPLVRMAMERHTREQARRSMIMQTSPFIPDPVTQGILSNPDRVETFRLDDFHEGENRTAAEYAALSEPHAQCLEDHAILRTGQPQGAAYAAAIGTALTQTRSPGSYSSCFDPGVGYRVWKGQAHTDLCVCFYCEGIEIITKDAHHKEVTKTMVSLGAARPAFLALSRQAFPQDKALAALKTS